MWKENWGGVKFKKEFESDLRPWSWGWVVMCGYRFKGNKKIKKIKRKKNKKEKKSECVWVSECDNCYESKKGNEWLV